MTAHAFADMVQEYDLEAQERMARIEALLLEYDSIPPAERASTLNQVKVELHTLKGNSGMMGFEGPQKTAHAMEDVVAEADTGTVDIPGLLKSLDGLRAAVRIATGKTDKRRVDAPAADAEQAQRSSNLVQGGVRVPLATLDELMDLLAEVVILRNQLGDAVIHALGLDTTSEEFSRLADQTLDDIALRHEKLGRTLDTLQSRIMQLRMVPIKLAFNSLRRIVHDEAFRGGKEVVLETQGGNVPLDKALLELANEALGHLVRNAVVHGVESAAARRAAGKPAKATIKVVATAEGDEVQIVVSDDGAGIDPKALRATAQRRGIELDDGDDPYAVLFIPGFSTKAEADLGAGRGVGLSAVQEAVRRQGGHVVVKSEPGQGAAFHMHLPLTVSIARALMIAADNEEYALPLSAVVATKRLRPGDGHMINHAGVFRWQSNLISLLDLGLNFGTATRIRDDGYVVVVESGGKQRGLVADEIRGIREVVVKGLDPIVGNPAGIGGTTVLGDGRAILILDPRALLQVEPFVEA